MRNIKTKIAQITVIIVLIGMIGVPSATITFNPLVEPVIAVSYDESDLAQFIDALLENITALISGSASGLGASVKDGEIVAIPSTYIRASTVDYEIFSASDGDYLHNANPEFLGAYWSFVKATGISSLKTIQQMSMSVGMGAEVEGISALLGTMAANDTSEATGFNVAVEDKFALEDLIDVDNRFYMDTNNYTYMPEIDAKYSNLLDDLNKQDTGTNFLTTAEVEETKNHEALVLGFYDTEDAILDVLRANIAANNSDATTTYTSSDVTILDYDFKLANQTTYMTENFVNRIRDKIDEIMEEEIASAAVLSIFGFTIALGNVVVPASAYVNSVNFDLFGAIRGAFDNTVKVATSFISDPIQTIKEVAPKIVEFGIKTSPLLMIGQTAAQYVPKTLGYLTGALSKPQPQPLIKTVPAPIAKVQLESEMTTETVEFVQKISANATNTISATADEIDNNADKATEITGMGLNEVVVREKMPMPANWVIIIAAVVAAFLLLGIGVFIYRRRKSLLVPI